MKTEQISIDQIGNSTPAVSKDLLKMSRRDLLKRTIAISGSFAVGGSFLAARQ